MSRGLRALDERTRDFFGGPGLGFLTLVVAIAFVIPGIGAMAGLDGFGVAFVLVAVAVCLVGVSRVLRRLRDAR